jgi:hypothetical protein
VKKIQEPVQHLDAETAELLLVHAAFDAITSLGIYNCLTDEEMLARLNQLYRTFREHNPLPKAH